MHGGGNVNRGKISQTLMASDCWAPLRNRVHRLSDRELAEVELLERLGRRRVNLLRVILAERKRRQGNEHKNLRLKIEVRR